MMRINDAIDKYSCYYNSQPRGFLTPPPIWKKDRRSSVVQASEKKIGRSDDLFHVKHKVPAGDSPYVRAKHVQLIDKDPSKAISLFWTAINSGDRVDSALKDMAIVMKQLDRSDEAIEAIKSFHHLCPPESQESLDNILIELYKQSGRIEEEIEMLQLKLKQVELGVVFSGKRTKKGRSQGKKIQITVEKEYSRLLGNLAWAYMQKKDFKSAEDHYRKALSFESDKNKQCNLAMCLMQLNKLTEARFLLQAIRVSSDNRCMDESYARSFERANQMLVELEKQSVLKPMYRSEHNDNLVRRPCTEFPYVKRAYETPFCNARIPRVPFTQPRRSSRLSSNKNKGFCGGGKSSLDQFSDIENQQPKVSEKNPKPTEEVQTGSRISTYKCSKSWADMVEEEDAEGFSDENVDHNVVQKSETVDLGGGYFTQPKKNSSSMNQVKRSLCFDQDTESNHCASPLSMKALNFEGPGLQLSGDSTTEAKVAGFLGIAYNNGSPRP